MQIDDIFKNVVESEDFKSDLIKPENITSIPAEYGIHYTSGEKKYYAKQMYGHGSIAYTKGLTLIIEHDNFIFDQPTKFTNIINFAKEWFGEPDVKKIRVNAKHYVDTAKESTRTFDVFVALVLCESNKKVVLQVNFEHGKPLQSLEEILQGCE